jgi:16S rRNA (uracil1498-N3)-methyltransferase
LDGEEGRPYIVLGIGQLADKSRFEWLVEKGVELGVREIVPLVTARSEGRHQGERAGRIAIAALKQSQRSFLPDIAAPVSLAAMLERLPGFDQAFICHESAPIGDAMGRFLLSSPLYGRIAILIGPEGGFTPEEAEAARGASAQVVSLGSSRLRAETAALAALVLAGSLSEKHCRQESLPDGTKSASATGI